METPKTGFRSLEAQDVNPRIVAQLIDGSTPPTLLARLGKDGETLLQRLDSTETYAVDAAVGSLPKDAAALADVCSPPVVNALLAGNDIALICLGGSADDQQTAMLGSSASGASSITSKKSGGGGLIMHTAALLFERLRTIDPGLLRSYEVRISYALLHRDAPIDLLHAGPDQPELKLKRAGGGRGLQLAGLSALVVSTPAEVAEAVAVGELARRALAVLPQAGGVGGPHSSSSGAGNQAIFELHLTQRLVAPQDDPISLWAMDDAQRTASEKGSILAKRTKVDPLSAATADGAGGSRVRTARARLVLTDASIAPVVGLRLPLADAAPEAAPHESRGMAALKAVVHALSRSPTATPLSPRGLEGPSGGGNYPCNYPPYRASLLTSLLQDSLGGDAHCLVLACISTAEGAIARSLGTLQLCARARRIVNTISVHESTKSRGHHKHTGGSKAGSDVPSSASSKAQSASASSKAYSASASSKAQGAKAISISPRRPTPQSPSAASSASSYASCGSPRSLRSPSAASSASVSSLGASASVAATTSAPHLRPHQRSRHRSRGKHRSPSPSRLHPRTLSGAAATGSAPRDHREIDPYDGRANSDDYGDGYGGGYGGGYDGSAYSGGGGDEDEYEPSSTPSAYSAGSVGHSAPPSVSPPPVSSSQQSRSVRRPPRSPGVPPQATKAASPMTPSQATSPTSRKTAGSPSAVALRRGDLIMGLELVAGTQAAAAAADAPLSPLSVADAVPDERARRRRSSGAPSPYASSGAGSVTPSSRSHSDHGVREGQWGEADASRPHRHHRTRGGRSRSRSRHRHRDSAAHDGVATDEDEAGGMGTSVGDATTAASRGGSGHGAPTLPAGMPDVGRLREFLASRPDLRSALAQAQRPAIAQLCALMASRADLTAALRQATDGLASNLNVPDEIATMIGGRAVSGSAPFSATAEAAALADRLVDAPPSKHDASRHDGDAHEDEGYSSLSELLGASAPNVTREPATRTRAVVSASRSLAASLACAGGLSAAEVAAMVSADAALADEAVVARAVAISEQEVALLHAHAALREKLANSERELLETRAAHRMREEDLLVLHEQVTQLSGALEAARALLERANTVGGYSGLRLQLDPALQKELGNIRAEWVAAARQAAEAGARASEETAVSEVLKSELRMAEETTRQQRSAAEELRSHVIKANRREEDLRLKLRRAEASMSELRASHGVISAELEMANSQSRELQGALHAAEGEVDTTRERLETQLKACELQRSSEIHAHCERASLWSTKLDSFHSNQGIALDLRVFITNDPVYRELRAALAREEALAARYQSESVAVASQQAHAELNLLNGRVASLLKANKELQQLRGTAVEEAQARALADTRERLVYLEREIEIQRSAGAEALERLSERERWAVEQVELERRLFAEALGLLKERHLAQQNEATSKLAAARTRCVELAERNEAIRECLAKRGESVWRRRLLNLTWHGWKGWMTKQRLSRVELDYTRRLRQKAEEIYHQELAQHARELSVVRAHADALAAQLAEVCAAQRDEGDEARRELGERVCEAHAEVERLRASAETEAALRQREVLAERERREMAEGRASSLQMQLAASEARVVAERRNADARVSAVEEKHVALRATLQAQQLHDHLLEVNKEASAHEKQRLLRRVEEAEAAHHHERRDAEHSWQEERTRLHRRLQALQEHVRLVEDEQQAGSALHAKELHQARDQHAQQAAQAERDLASLREAVCIANLAAEIAAKRRDKELATAHAALASSKRSIVHRLDERWNAMLLRTTWYAWRLLHAACGSGRLSGAQFLHERHVGATAGASAPGAGLALSPSRKANHGGIALSAQGGTALSAGYDGEDYYDGDGEYEYDDMPPSSAISNQDPWKLMDKLDEELRGT